MSRMYVALFLAFIRESLNPLDVALGLHSNSNSIGGYDVIMKQASKEI